MKEYTVEQLEVIQKEYDLYLDYLGSIRREMKARMARIIGLDEYDIAAGLGWNDLTDITESMTGFIDRVNSSERWYGDNSEIIQELIKEIKFEKSEDE